MAAARLQRWALTLSAYRYEIQYRKGVEHGNADCFSRLPCQGDVQCVDVEDGEIFLSSLVHDLPVTSKDPVLARLHSYVMSGWPSKVDEALKPYAIRPGEMSVENGCILWGLRVMIPPPYRERLMDDLHETHPGICRMKSIARSYLWWPCLDQDIVDRVGECEACQAARNLPSVAPLHYWTWPSRPWQRIHIDYAEKDGSNFLVIVDSHSKWMEVFLMSPTTSTRIMTALRSVFARFGLPEELVSDNGPQFTSTEFRTFLQRNGIRHTLVPPYHPASNGAAERCVQSLKSMLLKCVLDTSLTIDIEHRLSNWLLRYRNTTHATTGRTPAELFLQRNPRTQFSLLCPDLAQDVQAQQHKQKFYHDRARVKERHFMVREPVSKKNHGGGNEKWIPGLITAMKGPTSYLVRVMGGIRYVHVEHLLTRASVAPDCPTVPPDTPCSP